MHEIYTKKNLPYLAVKTCPNCNELVALDKNTCPNCFYNFSNGETLAPVTDTIKVGAAIIKEQSSVKKSVSSQEKVLEAEKPITQKFLYCECCGAKINEGQIYCGECGTRVSKVFCEQCQNIIDATLLYCPFCGTKQKKVLVKAPITTTPYSNLDYQEQQTTIIVPAATPQVTPSMPIVAPVSEDTSESVETKAEIEEKEKDKNKEKEVIEENKEKDEVVFEDIKEMVNGGRKRLFMILQIFVLLILGTMLTVMPVICNENSSFVSSIIPSFKNIKNPSVFKGFDLLQYGFTYIKSLLGSGQVIKINPNSLYFDSLNQSFIFSSLPFIGNKVTAEICITILILLYGLSYLSILFALIVSFIGLFSKKPVRGRSMGLVTIILFFFTALTFVHVIVDKREILALYLFAFAFLYWFLTKLVFFKENKRYYKKLYNE